MICLRSYVTVSLLSISISTIPSQIGTWLHYPNALPTLQMTQIPLLGNGHLGIALDARIL